MFSALASGGAECGPSNPLAQLSKTYNQDRGVQQDHFGAQQYAQHSFRQSSAAPTAAGPREAAAFFNNAGNPATAPFDMSPLNRALTPQQQHQHQRNGLAAPQAVSAAPDWAKAFMSSHPVQQQQQQPQHQWANDFAMRSQHAPARSSEAAAQHMIDRGETRAQAVIGQMPSYAFNTANAQPQYSGHHFPGVLQQQHQQQQQQAPHESQQWEKAFVAHLAQDQQQSHQQQAAEPIQRGPSPKQITVPTDKDALARTAGELLSVVRQSEERYASNQSTTERTDPLASDKFAQSTFLDLMRKLRDGEVAVEGDKVVEQIGPAVSGGTNTTGNVDVKGKGRAIGQVHGPPVGRSGMTNEFLRSRVEEGRPNELFDASRVAQDRFKDFGLRRRDGESWVEFDKRRVEAERQAEQSAYDDMRDVWEEEDRAREGHQRPRSRRASPSARQQQRPLQFQGDGGGLREEMMDDEDAFERADTRVPFAKKDWEEDFDADMIVGGHARPETAGKERQREDPSAQQREWDKLQQDWDDFEATATGLSRVSAGEQYESTIGRYTFAPHNPHLMTSHHHHHHQHMASAYDSILAAEAAVQRSPNDPKLWLALGIRQQENEREDRAIAALERALELDPATGEAYLALAVSFTNENERTKAYDMVDRWVTHAAAKGSYAREVDAYRGLYGDLPRGLVERHEYLTSLLISLARLNKDDVDPELQIALGVLFNTSEEYDKASDCFAAALAVRPDDPLLFNRLGATLANNGRTELAIEHYIQALELQPAYVRARFNLAVANMNLSQYQEACEQLITALRIQQADAELASGDSGMTDETSGGLGVTSSTLWDSLTIALTMLHRNDLVAFANDHNLAALKAHFPGAL